MHGWLGAFLSDFRISRQSEPVTHLTMLRHSHFFVIVVHVDIVQIRVSYLHIPSEIPKVLVRMRQYA